MVLSQKVDFEDGFLRQIADDPEGIEIEGIYGAALVFMRKFTRRCWQIDPSDIGLLRALGIPDSNVVDWIQMGAIQTLAVNQADGGGIFFPEEGSPVVGHDRAYYASQPGGLTAEAVTAPIESPPLGPNSTLLHGHSDLPAATTSRVEPNGWFEPKLDSPDFLAAAEQTKSRYGFVPNLVVALSNGCSPSLLPSTILNFEVLEAPQSERITGRQHALIRAGTAAASRSNYSEATIRAQLEATGEPPESYKQAGQRSAAVARDAKEELIFAFAEKAGRNAYKITDKDAAQFRDADLGDQAYLDVLGTVGLQLALDRMARATGVSPDAGVLLAS